MPSNFDFLPQHWSSLREEAVQAEQHALINPRTAAFYARRVLEKTVKWLYDYDGSLKTPYQKNLGALIHEPSFQSLVAPAGLFPLIRQIHIIGNQAAHSDVRIKQYDGLELVKALHSIFSWAVKVYTKLETVPAFDQALVPSVDPSKVIQQSKKVIQELEGDLRRQDQEYEAHRQELRDNKEKLAALRDEIQRLKESNKDQIDEKPDIISEADTRKWIIDVMLREAGWDSFKEGRDIEYPVTGMPNPEGKGWVDYVLWGSDGLPLAVVEAKRTTADPIKGQQQAKLYADCLETQLGQRPLMYYTNGYEIFFWDEFYPPRVVHGYATRDELQLFINRRKDRGSLLDIKPSTEIIERPYQHEAAKRVMERFEEERQRRALLAMATGTGKTRMSMAIVEMLMRQNWAKRVLFLADRTALVRQAKRGFAALLPNLSMVNLVEDKEKDSTRLVFSTYHTMMNVIDDTRVDGLKRFSPNYFDLVIIDEAHRSVYQKFRAIFEYFDSLLIGLTATPRDEVDRHTYNLFDCERRVPTYYYSLEKAVRDKFLVPPKAISVPLKFQREGIKYKELSEEEREEYEEKFSEPETGAMPTEVDAAALNKWLFNDDTVDKVLGHLMKNGIKIEGGDKLGKTIIFAKNHDHAVFINKRFDANYPHLAGKFLRVIDNEITYAHTLIDDFSVADGDPFIAVSVDMLDTGIDVPEIVNLVFFKRVHSATKFAQMVGRGTRLREDLFGPGKDKAFFTIFDYCQNFEFFEQYPQGIASAAQESLKQRIFRRRLTLARLLQAAAEKSAETENLHKDVLGHLRSQIESMNVDSFLVRPHRQQVEKYREVSAWEELKPDDYQVLSSTLSGLPTPEEDDEFARRFDLLVLNLSVAMCEVGQKKVYQSQITSLARDLEKKRNVPDVAKQLELIQALQTDGFWEAATVTVLEDVRRKLRDLIKFIDTDSGRKNVFTDFEDEIGEGFERPDFLLPTGEDMTNYKLKVERFVREHENHLTIQRLKTNKPITSKDIEGLESILFSEDGIGEKEKYLEAYGAQPLGTFIRSIVGLDRAAANEAFAVFLSEGNLTADQMTFINQIIDHLVLNGVMDPDRLFEQPFTGSSSEGVVGVFPEKAEAIVELVRRINGNAEAA